MEIDADLKGVTNGNGRHGVRSYTHTFKVGDDVRADVSVTGHTMKVTRNGKLVRTLSINAGSARYPTWNGTMAVIGKQEKVPMTSCGVGISCAKGSPDHYDLTPPWDLHLARSGTCVHCSTGDPHPGSGSARGSHGCVHLTVPDAKWFYGQVKQDDPVTVTKSPRAMAPTDNGYAAFNLGRDQCSPAAPPGSRRPRSCDAQRRRHPAAAPARNEPGRHRGVAALCMSEGGHAVDRYPSGEL